MQVADVWRVNGLPLDGGQVWSPGDANRLEVWHPGHAAAVLERHVAHLVRRGWRLADRDPSGHRVTLDMNGADLLAVLCTERDGGVWVTLAFQT